MKLATTTDDFCEYITGTRELDDTLEYFRETPFRHFDQIIKALIKIGYRGFFSFEAPDTLRVGGDSHHRRRDILPDDKLANPTVFLQQKITEVKYEIGKWMLETYGIYEK